MLHLLSELLDKMALHVCVLNKQKQKKNNNRYIKAKHLPTELDKVRWLHNFRGKISLLMPGSLDFIALHFCLVIIKTSYAFHLYKLRVHWHSICSICVLWYETKNRLCSYFSATVQKNLCHKILQLKLYLSVNLPTRCSYHGLWSCTCFYNNWLFFFYSFSPPHKWINSYIEITIQVV